MEAKNQKNRGTNEVTSSILQLRLLIGSVVVLISSLFSSVILNFTFEQPPPIHYLWMVIASTLFGTLISQSLEIFRLIYKPWKYMSLSVLQTLSSVGLALFFAYYLNRGIEGYLLGILVASCITMLIGWVVTREYCSLKHPDINLWKSFLKFGLPLLPAGLMVWFMQASDRWFIMHMLGSYEVGIYAIAAKVSLMVMVVVEVFRKACAPLAMDIMFKTEGPNFFKYIALWYVFFGSLLALLITYLSPFLIGVIATEEYASSWKLIGVLSWSSIFYGFYIISTRGIIFKRQTHLAIFAYGSGATLNVIFNYLLIPVCGMMGAALSTIFGLFSANVIAMALSHKYFPVDWPWGRMLSCIFVSIYLILSFVDFI